MERYLRVNLLGPGPRLMKKRIYRAAASQRMRNTELECNSLFVGTMRRYVRRFTAQWPGQLRINQSPFSVVSATSTHACMYSSADITEPNWHVQIRLQIIRLGESWVIILVSLVSNILLFINWQIYVMQQNTNIIHNL